MKNKEDIKKRLKSLKFISRVTDVAKSRNEKVYIVGGFVRDFLIGEEKGDIDFLVVGDGVEFAHQLAQLLNVKNFSLFKKFRTAHFNYRGFDLEFVGARKESYSEDSRNPQVVPATFEEDIARRDFTINALSVSLNEDDFGEIIDLYNGLEDLENGIIRTPLDPEITFSDDPLRIMRAIRFAGRLNFTCHDDVLRAAENMRTRLKVVSQERITDEFLKILKAAKPSVGLTLLLKTKVLEEIFPEMNKTAGVEQRNEYHHKDVFYHTCEVVDNISKHTDDVWLRFSALVHDIAKPQTKRFYEGIGWSFHGHEDLGAKMMKGIFYRMKLPLTKLEYVRKLVRLHLRPIALAKEGVTDSAVRRLIVEMGAELDDLLTLCRADITSKNPLKVAAYRNNYEELEKRIFEIREKDALREFQSPVRGEDIMTICNIKPGRVIGVLKTALEEAILDGKIGNNYDEAYNLLLEIKDEIIEKNRHLLR